MSADLASTAAATAAGSFAGLMAPVVQALLGRSRVAIELRSGRIEKNDPNWSLELSITHVGGPPPGRLTATPYSMHDGWLWYWPTARGTAARRHGYIVCMETELAQHGRGDFIVIDGCQIGGNRPWPGGIVLVRVYGPCYGGQRLFFLTANGHVQRWWRHPIQAIAAFMQAKKSVEHLHRPAAAV